MSRFIGRFMIACDFVKIVVKSIDITCALQFPKSPRDKENKFDK